MDKIFSKMGVLCTCKWEQVTLFCWYYIMSIIKPVLFFCFSEIKNLFFFCQPGSLFTFWGPKLECCKLFKSWKTHENIKPPSCNGHHIKDITLQTSHYRHIILWTLWLHDFNYGNSLWRNKCYMHTNFVQIYHIQVFSAFN